MDARRLKTPAGHVFAAIAAAFVLLLSGCAILPGSGEIKPRHYVRNAPIPVPYPAEKPRPPARAGSAAAVPSGGATVTVQKGDTVYAISRRTGTDAKTVIALNSLQPPYTLYPGQELRVGAARVHTVAKGETSYSISRSYGVDLHSLIRANGLSPPYTLSIGQQLVIPGGGAAPQQQVLNVPLPSREGTAFLWPVEGEIVSGFGPKDGGLHNDGINIRARRGEPVKASEAGVVVYAGDDLKGYGNLVLIRHEGGWVTAYAHNDRLLVARGDTVSRGDVVAWAGQSGGLSEPQLHFEVRKGTKAVDPLRYLAPRGG